MLVFANTTFDAVDVLIVLIVTQAANSL